MEQTDCASISNDGTKWRDQTSNNRLLSIFFSTGSSLL